MGAIFITVLSWVGAILGFVATTLSLACALYQLSEWVEEYTALSRKIIKHTTIIVAVIHVLLLFDGFPVLRIGFGLFCHAIYSLNLQTFPFIDLKGAPFLSSCALALVDHFLWFQYFTTHYHTFMEFASFFGICVWLVPFAYMVSLSANDNVLPTTGSQANLQRSGNLSNAAGGSSGIFLTEEVSRRKRSKIGLLKNCIDFVLNKRDEILPSSFRSTFNKRAF